MSKWSSAFRDSRWQKLRLEIMERDDWTCRSCGKKDGVTLNVHHAYYEAGKAPWEYPKQTLVTYCEECHKERHELQQMLLENVAKTGISVLKGLVATSVNYQNTCNVLWVLNSQNVSDDSIARVLKTVSGIFAEGYFSRMEKEQVNNE